MHNSAWIVINNVPTLVRTWGGRIKEEIESDSLILYIIGNPGITDFYTKHLSILFKLTNIPVWTLSHAGTEIPPASENMTLPSNKTNPELYTIRGQTRHKIKFITTYIPKTKKIYLIGHSVGAKICVELLKEPEISKRVKQVHLICPSLQHSADTPQGRIYKSFTRKIAPLIIALIWVLTLLPVKIREVIAKIYLILYRFTLTLEPGCINGLITLFTPDVFKGVLLFADNQMESIKELDDEIYENNYAKIITYFCKNDEWIPFYQCEDLKKKHPKIKCKVLGPPFKHAFVISCSEAAAIELSEEINNFTYFE